MGQEQSRGNEGDVGLFSWHRESTRPISVLVCLVLATTQIPVVSAHNATGTTGLSRWHGILLILVGVGFLGGAISLKRLERLSPTTALYGVFIGISVTALGVILFDGLSPDATYTARSMPFPRSWYQPLAMVVGLLVSVLSFLGGWLRWPTRPRYTFLGILMGVWILYPFLIPSPANNTHPLGYGIVFATPALVLYIVWKDAGSVLRAVMHDPVARHFGIGVGIVSALFFLSVTGYLSFFPEQGVPHQSKVVVLPVVYQLVTWPTVEIVLPHVPFFLAISPGQIILVGLLCVLIAFNATLIARHWRLDEQVGMTQGTAGTAAVVGSCTCGCCGPLVAKIAVLAVGPSIAAPLYWVFVDSASPLSAFFIVGSVVLFTASLIYSIESAHQPARLTSVTRND
jgi:hypothetical protein